MVEEVRMDGAGMGGRMNAKDRYGNSGTVLEELRIPTQVKLAGLWAAVMFMYVYVDIFSFFKPGVITDLLVGKIFVFDISQTYLISVLMLMTIPVLMVYLSLALPAKANRYVNISLGAIYIFITLGMTVGESWAYYIIGSVVEALLLAQIIWISWKWPKVQKNGAAGN